MGVCRGWGHRSWEGLSSCRGPHSLCPCALRVEWAQARQAFFGSGKNKAALDAIERAAFFVALDEESHHYDPEDEASLILYCKALLHGNCYNRYHAPAPPRACPRAPPPPTPTALLLPLQVVRQVLHAHLFQEWPAWAQHRACVGRCPYHRAPLGGNRPWEGPCRAGSGRGGRARMASQPDLPLQFVLGTDSFHLGYTETGHCLGKPNPVLPPPQRLKWDIPEQVCGPRRGRGGCVRVTRP